MDEDLVGWRPRTVTSVSFATAISRADEAGMVVSRGRDYLPCDAALLIQGCSVAAMKAKTRRASLRTGFERNNSL
jgi:hypothetical protein